MTRRADGAAVVIAFIMAGLQTVSGGEALPSIPIPHSIARVVDARWNPSIPPDYILIQDIHLHPEAQANIAAVLLFVHAHWGVRNVLVEGAYAGQPVSVDRWTGNNHQALRSALQEGSLGGPEMAAAMAPGRDLALAGLEDPELYRQNLQAFDGVRQEVTDAVNDLKTLEVMQRSLDMTQTRFSEEELQTMDLLVHLKMKPAEWSTFQKASFAMPESTALAGALAKAQMFYRLADMRSQFFLKAAEASESAGPKVLVVGGFHTAAMAARLAQEGKSYVVISPQITQSGFEDLYEHRMQESISALKLR